jgi:GntR family transcriptional regulator
MPNVNEPTEHRSNPLQGLRLDRSDPTPLHEQAAAAIRRAIAEGEAGAGERIPQARDLAAVLGIDRNTVLRALRLLRDEGLLEMGRGRAITVTGNADTGSVTTKAKELLEYARHRGYKREELIALITRLPYRR